MIKTLSNYRMMKHFLFLNMTFLLLSLCMVNISFAEQEEVEEFPWEIFYPAIIKKSIDKDKDGYTEEQGDCNNSDPSIHPGATELCDDKKDNDCDGDTDCNDTDCSSYLLCQISQKWKLPDTGQTQSYTDIFGEDSDYNINPPLYTDNGDGTVTDKNTRLMWQQGKGGSMTWKDAISYCESLTLARHTDWRLPSKKELISIVNYGRYSPSIDTTYFPATYAEAYWSSITYAHSSSYAWGVYFADGFADYIFKGIYSRHCVRCVRGGQ